MNHATPTAQPNVPPARADGHGAAACAACPHPRATHDPIATRFCAATTAGNHSRGCACGAGRDVVRG
ncbi:RGCVC family protein [Saccharothrix hoggarensis]|uniref:RGCVC family protein n=1 Tax=Saccharothrix hoggarensis TaxID=913853 RepID=A0ABW3R0J5_9PSEU